MKRLGSLLALAALSLAATVVSLSATGRRPTAAAVESAAAAVNQWEPILYPTGVTPSTPASLTVHPTDAYTAFLATWAGLYKTTDAAQSWSRVATSTFDLLFHFAIAPSDPQRMFAVSWNNSLYRSDNGGGNWSLLGSPPSICGITVAPSDADRVYVLGCGGNNAPTIFGSNDGGQSWITPTLVFSTPLDHLAVSPSNADVLVGADFDEVFRSGDGGATWARAAFGTRYFGQPVFDPLPPYTLYLGHWTGLMRSLDNGATWQESNTAREFTALIASPLTSGEVLGGDDIGSWRLASSGDAWNASAWNAPLPLQALWRSANDARVIYARNSAGLWRYMSSAASWSHAVYLPALQRNGSTVTYPPAVQQALDRLNWHRAQAGALPLRLHPAIVSAAQNHANYHMINYDDPSAWANGAHGEVPGKPGFTGVGPWERMVAAGYPSEFPWSGGSEVMHFWGDPVASVDGWMWSIYHRVLSIDPSALLTGYGYGDSSATAVDVMDFGVGPLESGMWTSATPYPFAYPGDGQTNVSAARFPFTLQGVGGALQVTFAELRDGSGRLVTVDPPPDCTGFNCYALIPSAPLPANTTFTVRAQGDVGGVAFNRTWTFTTGSASEYNPAYREDVSQVISLPYWQP